MDKVTKKTEELKLRDEEEEEERKGMAAFRLDYCTYTRELGPGDFLQSSAFDALTSAFFKCRLPAKGSRLSRDFGEEGEGGWRVWWAEGPLQNYSVRARYTWTEASGYRVETVEAIGHNRGRHRVDTAEEAFDILFEVLQRIKNGTVKPHELLSVWLSAQAEKSKNRVNVPKA